MRYVIIGAGPAGLAAVEAIREVDVEGEITLLTMEDVPAYSKPLITYLLGKKVQEKNMLYRTREFFDEYRVEVRTGAEVVRVDTDSNMVYLKNGEGLSYDRLLIATGGVPFKPPIEGLEKEGVFTFTRWCDEKDMAEYIERNGVHEAVVLGGGLIGLKTTEALMELGIKVHIVELADRILAATFDKKASEIITRALEKEGCEVHTNDTVVQVKGGKRISRVILKSGKEIKTRLLVVAIGVTPNVGFLRDSGVRLGRRGVMVDDRMRTSISNIYAAGDCTEVLDESTDEWRTIAIWPIASAQGKVAGYNMAGREVRYQGGIPMNSVELAGIPTISVGYTNVEGDDVEILKYEDPSSSIYKKLVIKNNKLIGAVFVGDIDRAGIYTGLITHGVDVSTFKDALLDECFGLIYLPKEYRKKLIEGELKVWLE